MKYIDEYRDMKTAKEYSAAIDKITSKSWSIMEICGGQTHSIIKYGIDKIIPEKIKLIHGPGCPVCVTPLEKIDKAIAIAQMKDVIFCSYGDMLRVPGSSQDLISVRAQGKDVRVVYSPLDAIQIAKENPDKKVVFFAIGFETTASVNAMALYQAKKMELENFYVLVSQVLVPPAMEAILSSTNVQVQGFLAAGHVCTVMGFWEYEPISERFNVPIVITGFEPLDLFQGIHMVIRSLERGESGVVNQYIRTVTREGNQQAQGIISKVFRVVDHKWRGIGLIPESGLALQDEYISFDAEEFFGVKSMEINEPEECISGMVLQGVKKPFECPAFGQRCNPDSPLGATMVSAEGACSIYYRFRG